ncbi:MAG: hypothetical protein P4L52_03335 [Acidocella sp.]|nr:hypothetical protein [Acidocella sp.]
MTFSNRKHPHSLKAREDHLLAAARGASREHGGPIPKSLTELLEIVEGAIVRHPTLAGEMSAIRDEILELIRLKARWEKLLVRRLAVSKAGR